MAGNQGRWAPGYRRVPAGQRQRFGKNIFMIANLERLRFMAAVFDPAAGEAYDENELDDGLTRDDHGKDIVLMLKREDNRAVLPIPLTSLTEEELDALQTFMNETIAAARPVVQQRDAIAKEAAERGEDTYFRRHRSGPVVSRFPGKI